MSIILCHYSRCLWAGPSNVIHPGFSHLPPHETGEQVFPFITKLLKTITGPFPGLRGKVITRMLSRNRNDSRRIAVLKSWFFMINLVNWLISGVKLLLCSFTIIFLETLLALNTTAVKDLELDAL